MRRLNIIIAVLIVMMSTSFLMATTILIQKPETVFKQAPLIVEVLVKDIEFKSISNLSTGEAWITLAVIDRIAGDCPSEILIRRGHVTPALQFLETEWDPPYAIGEHFIICLFPTSNGYSTMGLYNGKYVVNQDYINGTQIGIEQFKQQVKEIRKGQISLFPGELPRQTGSDVNQSLQKTGKQSKIMSAGSHLSDEFITWDFTWDTVFAHNNAL